MLKELITVAVNDYKQLLKNKQWMAIVIFLFFIVCISLSVYRVVIYMSDFNMFLDPAVDAKFFGKDPITTWTNNSYSPFFYSVMSIFSPFARWFAVILWSLISILSLMVVYSITKFFFPSLKTKHYVYVFLVICTGLVDNFQLGQCNILILALMMLSIYYAYHKKHISSALWIGFASAFKLVPAILFANFFLRKKYSTVALGTLFAILFTMITPIFFYSFNSTGDYLTSWFNAVLFPLASGDEMVTTTYSFCHTNQSLDGFLGRHFADYGINNYQIIPDLGIYYLVSPETFKLITLSLKALFLLLISFLSIKLKNNNRESIYISSAFFIYGILIISPVAWVNYYVLIIPLLFVFVSSLNYANKLIKGLFIGGAILMLSDVDPVLQSLSLHTIGGLFIFVATYITILKRIKKHPLN